MQTLNFGKKKKGAVPKKCQKRCQKRCRAKVPWYFVFLFLFFCLEPTVRKNMFKVFSQQLEGKITTAFERHFAFEDFTEVDQHTCKLIMDQQRCKTHDQQNSFLFKDRET